MHSVIFTGFLIVVIYLFFFIEIREKNKEFAGQRKKGMYDKEPRCSI